MSGVIEPIVGRYVHVDVDGETNRIYFEENGSGIPLVRLHTVLPPGKIGGPSEPGTIQNLRGESFFGPNGGLTEVLMRLENAKDRGRGPDVTPLRSASAH